MKKVLLFVLPVLAVLSVQALFAAEMQDVVYLKNGSIIHGTITEQVPDESLTIETKDGDVFVYKMSEIKKIKKEKAKEDEPGATRASGRTLDSNPEKDFALTVNPLGFLQFGPQVDFEIKTAPSLFVVASLRWHGAGILSYAISPHTNLGAFAFGGGIRYFVRQPETPDALFFGAFVQYGLVPQSGIDYWGAWTESSSYIAGGGEIGYRWRFNPAVLSLGGLAGGAQTVSDQVTYPLTPSHNKTNDLTAYVFGMLELSFGVEF